MGILLNRADADATGRMLWRKEGKILASVALLITRPTATGGLAPRSIDSKEPRVDSLPSSVTGPVSRRH